MNAYTAGNLPDRDLHEFSKFPDDMKIRILERLTVMVSYLYSMKIYRLDRMMRVCSDTKYVFCWTPKSLAHTDVISTDSQKLLSSKKYIGPASQQ
jgi:hypothetical protein